MNKPGQNKMSGMTRNRSTFIKNIKKNQLKYNKYNKYK